MVQLPFAARETMPELPDFVHRGVLA